MKTTNSALLIPFLLVMAVTLLCKVRAHDNTTWELLQANANRIPLYNPDGIREWNSRRYWLWDIFRTSTTPEIPSVLLDINDQLTQWEYLNSRIDMIGLFLFGPENGRSIIHSGRAPGQGLVEDIQCLKSTTSLFIRHCGCIHKHCLRRFRAFANICNHAVDKAAIKEALAFACGLERINYVVNVENPTITRLAPAPVRNSSEHCERVSVEGVSRKKLGSFAKMYRVLLDPSASWWNDEEAHICVHRDASLGLCHCEKDDWRSLENDQWSFVMSPYDQLFVDVKFVGETHGFVYVYLDEELQGWRYALLAIGFSLLFLATIASKCLPSSITTKPLAVRGIASIFIFQGSKDTLFATVAVVTCVTVYLLIRLIYDQVTREKRLRGRELTKVRSDELSSGELPSGGKKNTTVEVKLIAWVEMKLIAWVELKYIAYSILEVCEAVPRAKPTTKLAEFLVL